jgi:hypothetical protein
LKEDRGRDGEMDRGREGVRYIGMDGGKMERGPKGNVGELTQEQCLHHPSAN